MPELATCESDSDNPFLTTAVTAATGGTVTIPVVLSMLSDPTAAAPEGALTNGVSNGNTTDCGLAYVIGLILQQSTSLYRI